MDRKKMYFKIFENCCIVKGTINGAIYDLQRDAIYPIPISFYEILKQYNESKIEDVYSVFDSEEYPVLDSYFDFLIENEIVFLMYDNMSFPNFRKINFQFQTPHILSNLIISIKSNEYDTKFISAVSKQIATIKCQNVQLRFDQTTNHCTLYDTVMYFINLKALRSLELVIPYSSINKVLGHKELTEQSLLSRIIVYGDHTEADKNRLAKLKNIDVIMYKFSDFPRFKGLNETRFMNLQPNMLIFSEAKNHNLYYNGKAYIESDGNVYQSPFVHTASGNIFTSPLQDIVKTRNFQKYWNITKDSIKVCKDCEFRYTCCDGRVPKYNVNSEEYYYDSTCKYDPYTGNFKEMTQY